MPKINKLIIYIFLATLPKQIICSHNPYGDKNFDNVTNFKIITATIKFIKTTKGFEEALF